MVLQDSASHTDFAEMAFSPTHSPVYGGDTLTIALDADQLGTSSPDVNYFVVFEGTRRRHVVSARQGKDGYLYAYIPGHDIAEEVSVTLIQLDLVDATDNNNRPEPADNTTTLDDPLDQTSTATPVYISVAQCYLRYEYDSTFYLTKFLVSSVYNDHALDNLELIKSDRFDLSNEVLSTLDTRLCRALRNANLANSWHLLGGDCITDSYCEERETLLHFCARLGLHQVAAYLLEQPGSEDALRLTNRRGELPYTIARENGFYELAEMLSGCEISLGPACEAVAIAGLTVLVALIVLILVRCWRASPQRKKYDVRVLTRRLQWARASRERYNTHGMVTSTQDVVEMDNAVLRNYGNGTASLTSFLDSPSLERNVENEIDFLRETEAMIKVQRGLLPQGERNFNSDWPNGGTLHQTGASRSMPTLPLEHEMEESLERLLKQQAIHRDNIHSFLRTASLPNPEHSQQQSVDETSEADDGASTDGGDSTWYQRQLQQQQQTGINSLKDVTASSKGSKTGPPYGILEGSLSGLRNLTENLYQLREAQQQQKLLSKDLRKRHFARYSSSCPSLAHSLQSLPLSPIDEDHHKSMHDLVEELGSGQSPSSPVTRRSTHSPHSSGYIDSPYSASPRTQSPRPDGSIDQAIRICVNGVTVDSSDDLSSSQRQRAQQDSAGPSDRKYSRTRDGRTQVEMFNRRGSWCPERAEVKANQRLDQQTRVMMLAMTGKSLSLTSLEGEEESDDDELTDYMSRGHSAVEESIRAIGIPGANTPNRRNEDIDTRSLSPADSTSSSPPGREMPDPSVLVQPKLGGDLTLSSHNAKSLSDLSTTEASESLTKDSGFSAGAELPLSSSPLKFEERGGLTVPHSNMTKSLSTPSIPQATSAAVGHGIRERREGKHHDEDYQQFLEEYDAQFRRQKEIEEEDDNVSQIDKKSEMWKDCISEEQSPNDSDEKSGKSIRKEEKRRKPSVFSRFQNSYRTKKNKEKEGKDKERGHHFVAVSFSNSAACDACHKPMANKAALRCENCLVNVHEHNCKDQITTCDKNRNKALQRDGSSHGAHGPTQSSQEALVERQSASVPAGTSLRPSHSFKDKRSSSAPVKPQAGQLSAPAPLSHRHSLPTSSLFGSPPNTPGFFQWPPSAMGKFSLLDKAISEEAESDTHSVNTVTAMEVAQSNMTDTISESMESLDGVVMPSEMASLDDDPDLQLTIDEPEAWSITVDRKTLKKLSTKDIKRQDTIWELINTEKQYVKRLKIMQKIFAQSMLNEMDFTAEQVDRLFPKLDDLVELHSNFLRQLLIRQAINGDRFVEDIGDLLVHQFTDVTADKMKTMYGVFCSKHTEAMQLYKEFVKVDRKFQNFAKKCTLLSVCEKRDISDFILGVTVRLSKYPILIEAILKSTKDKKDRENLSQALLMSRDVVQYVDEKVAAYEKLIDIQNKLDSRAVVFKGKKFKRQDLTADGRELVHSGKIGWKSARGRVYDVLAVLLTDLIVFLQKNEQKYTFLLQDNKSCVIPLYRLLVREKRDARDSTGIYMISQNKATPEMYELCCQSKTEREEWVRILQDAIRMCPPDVEPDFWPSGNPPANAGSLEEERRKKEEHASQIKFLIDQLHKKDEAIKECCEEKNKVMQELMDISAPKMTTGSRPNSQEIGNVNESVELVQAAMEEASRLTTFLQSSGNPLSRSVSSVGEHHSNSYVATPMPKRAETFAGFDSSHDSPKMSAMKQRFVGSGEEGEDQMSTSMQSLDHDNSFTDMTDQTLPAAKELSEQRPSSSPQQISSQSPLQHSSHLWEEQVGSDRSSDRGSIGELSAASVTSLLPSPANQEHMTSMLHLVQYLNTLMNLTSKQTTKVESLRAELAEAKEEIAKLSADMHGRRNVYRHNQLEELRNLQENISRERQEWERTKLQDRTLLEREREELQKERESLEREKADLRTRKEEFKRQREALQRQVDMMREQGFLEASSLSDQGIEGGDLDSSDGHRQQLPYHRRSASADFYNSVVLSDVENIPNAGVTEPGVKALSRHPRLSVGNLGTQGNNSQAAKQAGLPMHLLSAKNEQRVGGVNVQRLPLKLAGSNSIASSNPSQTHQSVTPSAAFFAGVQQPFPGRAGSTGISRVQSMSAPSRAAAVQAHQLAAKINTENSHSAPSNLSRLMKLADPKTGSKSKSSGSPQSSSAHPGAPVAKSEGDESGEIIYF